MVRQQHQQMWHALMCKHIATTKEFLGKYKGEKHNVKIPKLISTNMLNVMIWGDKDGVEMHVRNAHYVCWARFRILPFSPRNVSPVCHRCHWKAYFIWITPNDKTCAVICVKMHITSFTEDYVLKRLGTHNSNKFTRHDPQWDSFKVHFILYTRIIHRVSVATNKWF